MSTVRILSGGAAQGVVNGLAPTFQAETGYAVDGVFGAVGVMRAKLRAGEAADLVILTSALIADLAREGYVIGPSGADVGVVQTAVAVRAGDAAPSIGDAEALRLALRKADAIYFPDPEQATAGIHFAGVLEKLGIWNEPAGRLRTFPNGATAMRELAASAAMRPIGCTQTTEILNTPGVKLVGPLPEGCDLATVYTAAVCANSPHRGPAEQFVKLLTGDAARALRARAGFIEDPHRAGKSVVSRRHS
jgi:molybdate transport system substrate-binding protein